MAEHHYQLNCNMQGLSESSQFEADADGPLDIMYEAERCTAAWLEVENTDGITRKIPILPSSRNGSSYNKVLKQGDKYKIVASIGRGGYLVTHLYS
jgi:hypothetical protein